MKFLSELSFTKYLVELAVYYQKAPFIIPHNDILVVISTFFLNYDFNGLCYTSCPWDGYTDRIGVAILNELYVIFMERYTSNRTIMRCFGLELFQNLPR